MFQCLYVLHPNCTSVSTCGLTGGHVESLPRWPRRRPPLGSSHACLWCFIEPGENSKSNSETINIQMWPVKLLVCLTERTATKCKLVLFYFLFHHVSCFLKIWKMIKAIFGFFCFFKSRFWVFPLLELTLSLSNTHTRTPWNCETLLRLKPKFIYCFYLIIVYCLGCALGLMHSKLCFWLTDKIYFSRPLFF